MNATFPFTHRDSFFISINVKRAPEAKKPALAIESQMKLVKDKLPNRLQINLRLLTTDTSPSFSFDVEMVSLFDLIGDSPVPSDLELKDFINQKAIPMMWPYMVSLLRQLSSQMGLDTFTIRTPLDFNYDPKPPQEAQEA